MARHTQRTEAYNAAYLTADRSHLVASYDLDPHGATGRVHPRTGDRVPPADRDRRRRAIVAFYGHRCGRCARPIATSDPGADAELAYAFSLGRLRDGDAPWALDDLVALCEPCFDLVDAADPWELDRTATRYGEAPQFPSWHCDPRVAVERAPLTGRELFRRELLDERVQPRFDFRLNEAVAEHAALALPTPATRAVALGVRLLAARTAAPSADECPERAWSRAPAAVRARYERRTLRPREIATGDRWARPAANDRPTAAPSAAPAGD